MPFNIGGYIYNGGIADPQDYYNIVNRGLAMNLDASAPSSYPGSGTVWSDISGQANNGTLTNGPTFSTDGVEDLLYLMEQMIKLQAHQTLHLVVQLKNLITFGLKLHHQHNKLFCF